MIGFLDSLFHSYSKLKAIILVQIGRALLTTLSAIPNTITCRGKWKNDVRNRVLKLRLVFKGKCNYKTLTKKTINIFKQNFFKYITKFSYFKTEKYIHFYKTEYR